jgi:hypothetical protein
MKIRNGLVANSSTSNFVCDLCGLQKELWDDGDMKSHGFTYCEENDHWYCLSHEMRGTECPACWLKSLPDGHVLDFIQEWWHFGGPRDEVRAFAKRNFDSIMRDAPDREERQDEEENSPGSE